MVATAAQDRVAAVREFNRFYTGVIGLLDEGLLHTPYSLTEARVLFELAQRDAPEVAELRRDLGLDAGYLSRILARFEADALVSRRRADHDARRQVIELSPQGRRAFGEIDRRSTHEIENLLGKLTAAEQQRLAAAMETIRTLLTDSARADQEVVLRAPEPGDMGWVVHRHGVVYAETYGWDAEFETLVAQVVADFATRHDPAREAAWIAEVAGEPVGCIFCVHRDDTTAQLRLLLVEPHARGLGVGSRLVDACMRFAREVGYAEMVLWTNDVLTAARRIYERAGFELVDESPHHSFGQDLIGQTWRVRL